MKRLGQMILILTFIAILFAIPVLTKLQAKQAISQFENRRLAEVPVLTVVNLLNGEYFSQWETYLSDHIYGRNAWIKGYTYLNMLVLGRSNINNIVIGKNGFLLPFFDYDNKYAAINSEENLNKMAAQFRTLQDRLDEWGGRFIFVGIPSQASYHRDKYPKYVQSNSDIVDKADKLLFDKLNQLGISYIKMKDVFRRTDNIEYYYKTDHHYNFEGAYATYHEIIDNIKQQIGYKILPPFEKDELNITTLPNPFEGSRNRQIYFMFPVEERIQIAYPSTKPSFEKFNNGKPDNRLYYFNTDERASVNYNVYMGGDWAETVIRTKDSNLPNLLIFGDSFTNAIEPLLFSHFNETRILDLRHYDKMSLYEYIDQYKPDVVLLVRDDLNYGNPEGNGSFMGENMKK